MAAPRPPYRPRHRRSRAPHGRLRLLSSLLSGFRPSDILFAILSAAVLLLAAFCLGGLLAHPF